MTQTTRSRPLLNTKSFSVSNRLLCINLSVLKELIHYKCVCQLLLCFPIEKTIKSDHYGIKSFDIPKYFTEEFRQNILVI